MIYIEQIQEVIAHLSYWEGIIKSIETSGQVDQLEERYKEARAQVDNYLDEWTCLQDERNQLIKNQGGHTNSIEISGLRSYSLRFYADGPNGIADKLFCYSVHHGGHMADLLTRFMHKGLTVKAAFLVGGAGGARGMQLGRGELDYLRCPGEREQRKIRSMLLSKYPIL